MRIAIIGSSGALGNALVMHYAQGMGNLVYAISRRAVKTDHENVVPLVFQTDVTDPSQVNEDEERLMEISEVIRQGGSLDRIIVATGALHSERFTPEKSLKSLSAAALLEVYAINTVLPALLAKYFIPLLARHHPSVFAALSARVGSISDNRLGGWYGYRMSKAALNMFLKTASIEVARNNKNAIIVGLHPGTVNSGLSKPFQARVPPGQLFSPTYAAQRLVDVIESLSSVDSGKIVAWDGLPIPY